MVARSSRSCASGTWRSSGSCSPTGRATRVLRAPSEFEDFGNSWTGADDRNLRHAIYAQDRWQITNRLTATLGIRYDYQRPHYEPSVRNPVLSEIFPAQKTEGQTLFTSHLVAARLGASY